MTAASPTPAAPGLPPRERLLVDRDLARVLGDWIRPAPGAPPIDARQVQPASLDLRLGARAVRVRAGFLPGAVPVERRVAELGFEELSLEGDGARLERGAVYLVPLEEELALPPSVRARFNPRSSAGRCDVFTRVLACGHPRFDEAPEGYRGRLWVEVSSLSFAVHLRRGDRLCQVRLSRGSAALSTRELREEHARRPLCFEDGRAMPRERVRFDDEGGVLLSVGLAGRAPAGWRARETSEALTFWREGAHDPRDFFEPVEAAGGHCVLEPGRFHVFVSRERLRVPPELAAEMLPVDVGIGELRNNYAGFFDSGFGWREDARGVPVDGGTPAVLEVRARDVPFLVEDGQVFFRLRFFRVNGRPERLYGEGRSGGSYRDQDLTLARVFRGVEQAHDK